MMRQVPSERLRNQSRWSSRQQQTRNASTKITAVAVPIDTNKLTPNHWSKIQQSDLDIPFSFQDWTERFTSSLAPSSFADYVSLFYLVYLSCIDSAEWVEGVLYIPSIEESAAYWLIPSIYGEVKAYPYSLWEVKAYLYNPHYIWLRPIVLYSYMLWPNMTT